MDYGYSSHRRSVNAISGHTLKGNKPFIVNHRVDILENRVNGRLRSVTILSDDSHTARAVERLFGHSVRY